MSQNTNEHLEDEARALKDTIDSMPGSEDSHEDEDDEQEQVFTAQPAKKKSPVLKLILYVGGALVVVMGGLVAYSMLMTPQRPPQKMRPAKQLPPPELNAAPGIPQGQQMPPIQGVVDKPMLPSDGRHTEPAAGLGQAPGLPGMETKSAQVNDPFANAKGPVAAPVQPPAPAANASAPVPSTGFGAQPSELPGVKKEAPEKALPAKVAAPVKVETALADDERIVEMTRPQKAATREFSTAKKVTHKTPSKKVAKKSAKKATSKKPVVVLPKKQPDNGYDVLF